jgi:hypothetical protein
MSIQAWIDTGDYSEAEAVIDRTLNALAEQQQARLLRLRELVRAGFDSGDGGEGTPETWAEIAREADRFSLPIRREIHPVRRIACVMSPSRRAGFQPGYWSQPEDVCLGRQDGQVAWTMQSALG